MTDTAIGPPRRRMIEDMTVRGFAAKTQSGYLRSVSDFAAFLGRPPDEAEDLRRVGPRFSPHLCQISK